MKSAKQFLLFLLLTGVLLLPFLLTDETAFTPNRVVEVNDSNFKSLVVANSVPVVVDIVERSCRTQECAEHMKEFDRLAGEFRGRLRFVRLYADESPRAASLIATQSVPSVVVIQSTSVGTLEMLAVIGEHPTLPQLRSEMNKALQAVSSKPR